MTFSNRSILILHSNDIHSRLENAARMMSYIEEQRAAYGSEPILCLDIGDHMDRIRLETEGSDGMVNVELLNAAGYDAATLGNNEGLTYSKDTLERVYREAKFKILGANMRELGTGKPPDWLLPSTVMEKNGIRVGLIAATARYTDFYELLGWDLTDPFEAIGEEVKRLREQVDVIAVMSHLGINVDKQMAEKIPGIDLIMGGHTHHLLEEPLVIGGTSICAAGKYGEQIGRIELELDESKKRLSLRAACVPMAAYAEHPAAAAIIGGYREAGERRLSRVIARLDAPLPALPERESPLGNLLAAGLRRHADAEIGIVNTGQLLGGLQEGDVTEGQLHALCPSPINPCRMVLSGANIRAALEEALLPSFTGMPIKGYGFRGEVLGTLAIDGMEVEYDPSLPEFHRILSIRVNGEPLSDERDYVVGCIDMFTFHIGYLSLGQATEVSYYLPEFIRDLLAAELREGNGITACHQERWRILSNF
ncbi:MULTISPECIES: bifunctional UDP-sugar hydrolase/5'-nucleotidase [unclassified Paenibacillus]|uniref:bifunctional metallophosphatase/5'-nucleotidase n=1 Tax=unclassified Paenibacillus TaxID=185978 RepID=UPI001044378D|nr:MULTISPECIES: bifunctional UDP-sugar hydrolase/5'-nucleotidase [unclassified Paenibacillus]NIK69984.1 2',3'-cyclic-nucleotide 2'-phosphodiesterase (5'-nucleotidase family) [Paenibacillus sp. BK720]TCM97816.1 2',3'-cyclic-nucleotide 2'-phosphodiesterase (5'-nucleotidase family) [Paenibacillus sp. BK033]